MGKVSFKRGTSEQYASKVPNSDTIYFLTDTGEICLGNDKYSSMYGINTVDHLRVMGTTAVVARENNATKLCNPFCIYKGVCLLGCTYNEDSNKAVMYTLWSTPENYCDHYESYILFKKNSEEDPYELTFENAPSKASFNLPDYSKYRITTTATSAGGLCHIDVRFVRICYDENDNEIDRIYSAQYRYTLSNGVYTRTWVDVAPTSGTNIIDISLRKESTSVANSLIHIADNMNKSALYPLITVGQTTPWDYLIDDSLFNDAPYGYAIAVTDGSGVSYIGPIVYKAPDDYEGEIYEIYDGELEVG